MLELFDRLEELQKKYGGMLSFHFSEDKVLCIRWRKMCPDGLAWELQTRITRMEIDLLRNPDSVWEVYEQRLAASARKYDEAIKRKQNENPTR